MLRQSQSLKPKPTDSSMKLLKFQRAGGTNSEQLLGWDLFLWCKRLVLNMRLYFHHPCQCECTKWFYLMCVYRTDEIYIIAQIVSKYLLIKGQRSLFFSVNKNKLFVYHVIRHVWGMYLCSNLSYSSKPKKNRDIVSLSPQNGQNCPRYDRQLNWLLVQPSPVCQEASNPPPAGVESLGSHSAFSTNQQLQSTYSRCFQPTICFPLLNTEWAICRLNPPHPIKDGNRLVLFPLFWGIVINFKWSHFV